MDRWEQMKRVGGSAFPGAGYCDGMTLRDWFASQAPPMDDDWASLRREDWPVGEAEDHELRLMAEWAYAWADAMLAARA